MAFKKFAQFSGRSRRSEYWYFVLFNVLVSILLYLPALFAFDEYGNPSDGAMLLLIPYFLYVLVAFIPGLALSIRSEGCTIPAVPAGGS